MHCGKVFYYLVLFSRPFLFSNLFVISLCYYPLLSLIPHECNSWHSCLCGVPILLPCFRVYRRESCSCGWLRRGKSGHQRLNEAETAGPEASRPTFRLLPVNSDALFHHTLTVSQHDGSTPTCWGPLQLLAGIRKGSCAALFERGEGRMSWMHCVHVCVCASWTWSSGSLIQGEVDIRKHIPLPVMSTKPHRNLCLLNVDWRWLQLMSPRRSCHWSTALSWIVALAFVSFVRSYTWR